MALYEQWNVNFTIYENKSMGATRSDLANLYETVSAVNSTVAQAMVEAQYGRDNIVVHSVMRA